MLGTGGGWLVAPPSGSENICPNPVDCATVTDDVDVAACAGACNASAPCLYDVDADPFERRDLAAARPDIVAAMLAALATAEASVVPKYTPASDTNGSECRAWETTWDGFIGPWIGA